MHAQAYDGCTALHVGRPRLQPLDHIMGKNGYIAEHADFWQAFSSQHSKVVAENLAGYPSRIRSDFPGVDFEAHRQIGQKSTKRGFPKGTVQECMMPNHDRARWSRVPSRTLSKSFLAIFSLDHALEGCITQGTRCTDS